MCTDEIPATVALRPLVVIDTTAGVAKDAGYAATIADVEAWEAVNGRIPPGAVVFFRSDWSKKWDEYSVSGLPEPFPAVAWQTLKHLHTQVHFSPNCCFPHCYPLFFFNFIFF